MAQSLSAVYIHIIFSTKNRETVLNDTMSPRLWVYLGGICSGLQCKPIQIGGMPDHIHIFCMLSREVTLKELVGKVKTESAVWLKKTFPEFEEFHWQNGYGVFSVNPTEYQAVQNYILNQAVHHTKKDFRTELCQFLKKYGIPYDDKYLWN